MLETANALISGTIAKLSHNYQWKEHNFHIIDDYLIYEKKRRQFGSSSEIRKKRLENLLAAEIVRHDSSLGLHHTLTLHVDTDDDEKEYVTKIIFHDQTEYFLKFSNKDQQDKWQRIFQKYLSPITTSSYSANLSTTSFALLSAISGTSDLVISYLFEIMKKNAPRVISHVIDMKEKREILHFLQSNNDQPKVATIFGSPGAGKTTMMASITAHVIHIHELDNTNRTVTPSFYADSVIFVDLKEVKTLEQLYYQIAITVNCTQGNDVSHGKRCLHNWLRAILRYKLQRRNNLRIFFMLDGADGLIQQEHEQNSSIALFLNDLFNISGDLFQVILASRSEVEIPPTIISCKVKIHGFEEQDSLRLLYRSLEQASPWSRNSVSNTRTMTNSTRDFNQFHISLLKLVDYYNNHPLSLVLLSTLLGMNTIQKGSPSGSNNLNNSSLYHPKELFAKLTTLNNGTASNFSSYCNSYQEFQFLPRIKYGDFYSVEQIQRIEVLLIAVFESLSKLHQSYLVELAIFPTYFSKEDVQSLFQISEVETNELLYKFVQKHLLVVRSPFYSVDRSEHEQYTNQSNYNLKKIKSFMKESGKNKNRKFHTRDELKDEDLDLSITYSDSEDELTTKVEHGKDALCYNTNMIQGIVGEELYEMSSIVKDFLLSVQKYAIEERNRISFTSSLLLTTGMSSNNNNNGHTHSLNHDNCFNFQQFICLRSKNLVATLPANTTNSMSARFKAASINNSVTQSGLCNPSCNNYTRLFHRLEPITSLEQLKEINPPALIMRQTPKSKSRVMSKTANRISDFIVREVTTSEMTSITHDYNTLKHSSSSSDYRTLEAEIKNGKDTIIPSNSNGKLPNGMDATESDDCQDSNRNNEDVVSKRKYELSKAEDWWTCTICKSIQTDTANDTQRIFCCQDCQQFVCYPCKVELEEFVIKSNVVNTNSVGKDHGKKKGRLSLSRSYQAKKENNPAERHHQPHRHALFSFSNALDGDVQIMNWKIDHDDHGHKHVSYELTCKIKAGIRLPPESFTLNTRYSELLKVHEQFANSYFELYSKHLRQIHFPPKYYFNNFTEARILQRKRQLQEYFQAVLAVDAALLMQLLYADDYLETYHDNNSVHVAYLQHIRDKLSCIDQLVNTLKGKKLLQSLPAHQSEYQRDSQESRNTNAMKYIYIYRKDCFEMFFNQRLLATIYEAFKIAYQRYLNEKSKILSTIGNSGNSPNVQSTGAQSQRNLQANLQESSRMCNSSVEDVLLNISSSILAPFVELFFDCRERFAYFLANGQLTHYQLNHWADIVRQILSTGSMPHINYQAIEYYFQSWKVGIVDLLTVIQESASSLQPTSTAVESSGGDDYTLYLHHLLFNGKACINSFSLESGCNILMISSMSGNLELVKLLLNAGADVSYINTKDHNKRAIDYAREYQHHEIVALLEELQKKSYYSKHMIIPRASSGNASVNSSARSCSPMREKHLIVNDDHDDRVFFLIERNVSDRTVHSDDPSVESTLTDSARKMSKKSKSSRASTSNKKTRFRVRVAIKNEDLGMWLGIQFAPHTNDQNDELISVAFASLTSDRYQILPKLPLKKKIELKDDEMEFVICRRLCDAIRRDGLQISPRQYGVREYNL